MIVWARDACFDAALLQQIRPLVVAVLRSVFFNDLWRQTAAGLLVPVLSGALAPIMFLSLPENRRSHDQ